MLNARGSGLSLGAPVGASSLALRGVAPTWRSPPHPAEVFSPFIGILQQCSNVVCKVSHAGGQSPPPHPCYRARSRAPKPAFTFFCRNVDCFFIVGGFLIPVAPAHPIGGRNTKSKKLYKISLFMV